MHFERTIDNRVHENYLSWDLFRRKQLENICKLESIQIREGATHTEMKIMLESNGIDARKYKDIVNLGILHNNGNEKTVNLEEQVRSKTIKQVILPVNFEKMKMYELRQECKLQGIPWTIHDKKVTLLARIRDRMNGNIA